MTKQLKLHRQAPAEGFDYSIFWEDSFSQLPDAIRALSLQASKVCLVTDSTVGPLYADEVTDALLPIFQQVDRFVFPAGEASKNLDTARQLYEYLIEKRYERRDILIALGGGVVGDLAGFVAATYLRGIDFIQIPTTLLAQVDSSVGGKTGVDLDQYKNMVGAFHQPRLVYMNTNTLKTLDEEQFASGMGEVLKTALICDGEFYEWVINHMDEINERVVLVLSKMIRRCCKIKADIVEKDPTEQGERVLLNFGHTIGHAIEKLKGFRMLHGHCVALGTIAAAHISYKRELLSIEEFYEIRDMNIGFDLPMFFGGLKSEEILETTKSDKKMTNGKIRFVLLDEIGHAFVDDTVSDEELLEAINFINGDLIDGE